MGWPQVVVIAVYALSLGVSLAMHGKPRTGEYNFIHAVIGSAIVLTPLYLGGFFTA